MSSPPTIGRRALLASAAAAAGLALAGCSSSRARQGEQPPKALEETVVATAMVQPSVALVGDSISFLSRTQLETNLHDRGFGQIHYDAISGRRIAEGDDNGLAALDLAIGAGIAPQLWIVELGTNDLGKYGDATAYAELINLVLQRLPPTTPLVWVDTYSAFDVPSSDLFNATLRETLAPRANTAIAGWYAKILELGPNDVLVDGLHPKPESYQIFADVTVAPVSIVS